MENLFKTIAKKIDHMMWSCIWTGIILIMLAILNASFEFAVRLTVSISILVVAYIFIYIAYKLWSIKQEIQKHFKF